MRNREVAALTALALVLLAQFSPTAFVASGQVPSEASSLYVTISPPNLPSDGRSYPAVVVSLLDKAGLPSIAIEDIQVYLTSSRTNIATVPDQVVIQAGKEYVVAQITTTQTPGTTAVTALSSGLSSASTSLTTDTPSGYPSKLKVLVSFTQPNSGLVRIEVVDDAGLPSKAISDIPVQITSSNTSVGVLSQNSLTIAAGAFYSTGAFSSPNIGQAVITAASTGYSPGGALLTHQNSCTSPCRPDRVMLRLLPGVLPTDGHPYDALEVSLASDGGGSVVPATSTSDLFVQLTSSKSEVASTTNLVTVPSGDTSILVPITTSALAGNANITATSSNLAPDGIEVNTVIPAPSNLAAYVAPPSSSFSTNHNAPILVVQLQDSAGNPARARQDTNIVVTSSNSTLVNDVISMMIPKGNDYAYVKVNATSDGTSVLTAASQGLSSSQVNLVLALNPLRVSLSSSRPYIYTNQTAYLSFSATFLGKPVTNLNVTWVTSKGSLSSPTTSTGTGGSTANVYSPSGSGSVNITATASSPLTGPIFASLPLTIYQAPPKPAPTFIQILLSFWYYIVAAVAVAIVALFYVFRLRRKKQRAEIEAGFEVV